MLFVTVQPCKYTAINNIFHQFDCVLHYSRWQAWKPTYYRSKQPHQFNCKEMKRGRNVPVSLIKSCASLNLEHHFVLLFMSFFSTFFDWLFVTWTWILLFAFQILVSGFFFFQILDIISSSKLAFCSSAFLPVCVSTDCDRIYKG